MAVGGRHHVAIGGTGYVCKFDSRSNFSVKYQDPFIDRQSVAVSKSEGDYNQDLVFTQTSWAQGEAATTMNSDNVARYRTSNGIDVSGSLGGLSLLHDITKITGGANQPAGSGQPQTEGYPAIIRSSGRGIYMAWPANTLDSKTKYFWHYDGSSWTGYTIDSTTALSVAGLQLLDMVVIRGHAFLSFGDSAGANGGIIRYNPGLAGGNNYGLDIWWNQDNPQSQWAFLGTNGSQLYTSTSVYYGVTQQWYTLIYEYGNPGNAPLTPDWTTVSDYLSQSAEKLASHAGDMYALGKTTTSASISAAKDYGEGRTMLFKYDGSNFVPWKELPKGFYGYSMHSDGSVLYIGGQEACAEGNLRAQIYYITGASASESIGKIASFGERDGSSNYNIWSFCPHGDSVYFDWRHIDSGVASGLGRYDTVNGGISRSYQQTDLPSNAPLGIEMYDDDLYFVVDGTDATDQTGVWKTQSSTYVSSGTADSAYADFGLPSTEKLFVSVTVITPTALSAATTGDIAISYSTNKETSTWTSLSASLAAETEDTDSSDNMHKYTIAFSGGGIRAHSLAVRLTLSSNTSDNTATPVVTAASTNALTMLRAPGKTAPRKEYTFSIVLADKCKTINSAIEKSRSNLTTLEGLVETQDVTTFEAVDAVGTVKNAVIKSMSEVAYNYSKVTERFEATADLTVMTV